MEPRISITAIRGSCQILLNNGVIDLLKSLGCTPDDYKLLTQSHCWAGVDRPRVERILEGLLYGTVDYIGLPRFELGSEYICSVICCFVHPANYFASCSWLGQSTPAQEMAEYNQSQAVEGLETVTPRQMLAVLIEVASDDPIDALCRSFEKKTGKALGRIMEQENGS